MKAYTDNTVKKSRKVRPRFRFVSPCKDILTFYAVEFDFSQTTLLIVQKRNFGRHKVSIDTILLVIFNITINISQSPFILKNLISN